MAELKSGTKRASVASKKPRTSAKVAKSKVVNKKLAATSKAKTKSLEPSSKKLSFKFMSVQKWLAVSVVINILLVVFALATVSDPTKYTDATAGFTISIPGGWTRDDALESFREIRGSAKNPTAQIYAYGQRNTTAGFYALSEEQRNSTLDQVTDQINGGTNQFVLGLIGITDAEYVAARAQQSDGAEMIKSSFTAKDSAGDEVKGQHLLVVSKSGGAYSVVAFAKANAWNSMQEDISQVIDTFYAQ